MNPLKKILWLTHPHGALGLALLVISAGSLASADDLKDKMAAALTGFAGQSIGIESVRSSPAPGIAEVQIENGPLITRQKMALISSLMAIYIKPVPRVPSISPKSGVQ